MNSTDEKYLEEPNDGVWITGLYLEGASWDRKQNQLAEAIAMELLSVMPAIHFKVVEQKKKSSKGSMIDQENEVSDESFQVFTSLPVIIRLYVEDHLFSRLN